MKRKIVCVAALLTAAALLAPSAHALSAQRAIVLDAATGRVLYEKNADERALIASTTKIMTALIVCEQCNVLDRVKIPREAVGVEGSCVYLQADEVLTVQELLYALMLSSGNDAALALAIYCGGTVEGFAELMNDKARLLGMTHTHFVNPHGLDYPDHYSTARDLATLACFAMQNAIFAKTVSTKQVTVGKRTWTNHNRLLWRVRGADGIKTGYTRAAGRILVSTAVRDGRRVVVVTLNDPDDWNDHAKLYETAFSRYTMTTIVTKGECLGSVYVFGGESEQVHLLAAEDFSCALATQEQPQLTLSVKGYTFAPVVRDAPAGYAYVRVDGKLLGRIPLVYAETIEMQPQDSLPFWQRLFGGRK